MSYDIQIWSVRPVVLPAALPDRQKWHPEGEVWQHTAKSWQITVTPSLKVSLEDIPEDVVGLLPGICYLTELTLEPLVVPKSAQNLLIKVSRCLAKDAHGVVLDRQTDTLVTPTGVQRYRPQQREERFSILKFSWWFTDGPLLTNLGLHKFIELMEDMLPEAIPRRYGLYEPPQYLYTETGREHFLAFLQKHLDKIVVWYPHRPVVGVYLHCGPKWGATPQGFRANHVEVEIEARVLEQPGWNTGLARLWQAASQTIQPFYGDVRTLRGGIRTGATYTFDTETEFHPVNGIWWKGIPRTLGQAVVLGRPYLNLWPRFVEAAQIVNDLAFFSTSDWTTLKEVSGLVGGVPETIAQCRTPVWIDAPFGGRTISWNTEYPPIWPFRH